MKKLLLYVLIITMALGLFLPSANAQQSKKAWTLMLYFAPDKELEEEFIGKINAMTDPGSGKDLNIVLMFNYASAKPTTYYYVNHHKTKKLKEIGENSIVSPQELSDFINFSMTNYPAEHYALIVNSNSSGWEPYHGGSPVDYLTLKDLKESIKSASETSNNSKKLDLFITDASLFAMIEAAYELRDAVSIVMGSENAVPEKSIYYHFVHYNALASDITKNPKIDALEFSKLITIKFNDINGGNSVFAGINTSKIEPLAVAISELAAKLLKAGGKISFDGISKTGNGEKCSDILSIVNCILNKKVSFANDPAYSEIANQAEIVKEKLNESFSALSTTVNSQNGPSGMSAYWPDKATYSNYKTFYKALDFSNKFQWDEFLDSQLLDINPAPSAAGVTGNLVSELDNTFLTLRNNAQLNEKVDATNESAKIEHLKKIIVDNAIKSHKTGNYKAVNETLRNIRNAKSIDTATKNKMINDLKQGTGSQDK